MPYTPQLLYERFIVNGRPWDFPPHGFMPETDEYGVRAQSYPTLGNSRMIVTLAAPPDSGAVGIAFRKVKRQVFHATWNGEAWVDLCMRDHLYSLYYQQNRFWLQFDNEMSRELAELIQVDNTNQFYFTPTFPIAPYGYTPAIPVGYENTVFVNGAAQASGFTVDSETGLVRFNTPLTATDVVQMKYTWRMYCRIVHISLQPEDLAQQIYGGDVIFEQVTPNYGNDPWRAAIVCGSFTSVGAQSPISFGFSPPSIPWGDSRFSGGSFPSGGASLSLGSVGTLPSFAGASQTAP